MHKKEWTPGFYWLLTSDYFGIVEVINIEGDHFRPGSLTRYSIGKIEGQMTGPVPEPMELTFLEKQTPAKYAEEEKNVS